MTEIVPPAGGGESCPRPGRAPYSDDKCGQCLHWHKMPDGLSLRLGARGGKVFGSCRAAPPVVVVVPTQMGMAVETRYPTPSADMPACSMFSQGPPGAGDENEKSAAEG
jgi:hypothetical protein